jgi:hypothetical protein
LRQNDTQGGKAVAKVDKEENTHAAVSFRPHQPPSAISEKAISQSALHRQDLPTKHGEQCVCGSSEGCKRM